MSSLHNIRHDLRAPITVIKGYAELIVEHPERAIEFAQHIQDAVERLNVLLDVWRDREDLIQ